MSAAISATRLQCVSNALGITCQTSPKWQLFTARSSQSMHRHRQLQLFSTRSPQSKRHCRHLGTLVRANLGEDSTNEDLESERRKLMKMMEPRVISGAELRQLIMNKWNREYDCRLTRRGKRMYLQVFWKFLGQRSFPLTEEEYQLQLDAVAEYLTMWQVADVVRAGINSAKWAPGHTIGGGARAYSIPLGVDVGDNGRSDEWNSF